MEFWHFSTKRRIKIDQNWPERRILTKNCAERRIYTPNKARPNNCDISWAASGASEIFFETTPFGSLENAPVLQIALFNRSTNDDILMSYWRRLLFTKFRKLLGGTLASPGSDGPAPWWAPPYCGLSHKRRDKLTKDASHSLPFHDL